MTTFTDREFDTTWICMRCDLCGWIRKSADDDPGWWHQIADRGNPDDRHICPGCWESGLTLPHLPGGQDGRQGISSARTGPA